MTKDVPILITAVLGPRDAGDVKKTESSHCSVFHNVAKMDFAASLIICKASVLC